MNLENNITNSQVNDNLKDLILAYINAKNAKDDAKAETLLYEINQLRRITNDKINTQHKNKSA